MVAVEERNNADEENRRNEEEEKEKRSEEDMKKNKEELKRNVKEEYLEKNFEDEKKKDISGVDVPSNYSDSDSDAIFLYKIDTIVKSLGHNIVNFLLYLFVSFLIFYVVFNCVLFI